MNKIIKPCLIALLVGISFLNCVNTTNGQASLVTPTDSVSRLTILFAGDVMGHQPQIDAAWDASSESYQYDSCFNFVRLLVSSYDFAIANLEVTLGGSPYTGYPQFSSPNNLALALKNAGFDLLATANNHSVDRGRKGIERTIQTLDSLGIPHYGTYIDSSSRSSAYPLIVSKNGIKIALLNYTYGTNGIKVPSPNIVNLIDENQIIADLKAAKDSMPDKIIVFTHWGDEYNNQPNDRQKNLAKFFFDNGADIVIGGHPHVLQKMERYPYPDSTGKEVMIVYSLGNFISAQRTSPRDGGATIGFELIKKNGKTEIGFSGYYLTWVWIPKVDGKDQFYIMPISSSETTSDLIDANSAAKMKIFADKSRSLYNTYNKGIEEFVFDVNTKEWKIKGSEK